MSEPKTQIVVIGAGYAGLLLAVRLGGKTKGLPIEITLVNASDTFLERLRLHQYATNQTLQARPILEMLRGTGVKFLQGRVTAIHPAQREITVETENGLQYQRYDQLVYALGSTVD